MAEKTTEKLTACKDCRNVSTEPADRNKRYCMCDDAPSHFSPWSAVHYSGVTPLCIQINTDGHCPHFEAKQ